MTTRFELPVIPGVLSIVAMMIAQLKWGNTLSRTEWLLGLLIITIAANMVVSSIKIESNQQEKKP